MWTPVRAAGAALSAILLSAAAGAQAQGIDPTARYDIDEALHRHPHDIDRLPTKEAAEGRTRARAVTTRWAPAMSRPASASASPR